MLVPTKHKDKHVKRDYYGYLTFEYDMTFEDFLKNMCGHQTFRQDFISKVVSTGFKYCFIEFPVYTKDSKNNKAEFTVSKSEKFPRANWKPFNDQLKDSEPDTVKSFYNLSGDTYLIVPTPNSVTDKYANHIMNFMKNGNSEQMHELLRETARYVLEKQDTIDKMYISTHGHGVPWLHIRISNRPKYYVHETYKN